MIVFWHRCEPYKFHGVWWDRIVSKQTDRTSHGSKLPRLYKKQCSFEDEQRGMEIVKRLRERMKQELGL